MEITLDDQNFDNEIQKAEKPILVDFWAEWCGPCNILSPILDKLAEENKDKFILAKVNVDAAPIASQKFGIQNIPTVALFIKGKPVSGFVGVRPEKDISEWLFKTIEEQSNKEENQSSQEQSTTEESESSDETNENEVNDNNNEDKENKGQSMEEIIKWYENYAEENGFKLNPDKTVVENLVKGLLANEEKHSQRYCPCRRVTGNIEEDRDKICPCKWHKEEIERDGKCYCGLFFKK
ncbi:MAG: thioredoxin [Patescibacteria group bacterium]|nr:thioredoxin [Patescibacteria group bacterium]